MASHSFRKTNGGRKAVRGRRCVFESLESRALLAADIATGLAHHWKFDETAGDTAADSAGGSNGTLVNWGAAEPKWEPGRVGGALRFSTADNYVIAQPPAMSGEVSNLLTAEEVLEQHLAAGREVLEPARAMVDEAGVQYDTEIVIGRPAEALVEHAQKCGCDAIVMGASSHGRVRSLVLGSVAAKVAHMADVPVTVVK